LADRIFRAEEFVPRRISDDADGSSGAKVGFVEKPAAGKRPVVDAEIGGRGARDARRTRILSVDGAQIAGAHRGNGRDAVKLRLQCFNVPSVKFGTPATRTLAKPMPGRNVHQIAAELDCR